MIHFEERIIVSRLTSQNATQYFPLEKNNSTKGYLLLLCDEGDATFMINNGMRTLKRNMVMITLPDQMFALTKFSSNLKMTLLYMPMDVAIMIDDNGTHRDVRERFLKNIDTTQLYNLLQTDHNDLNAGQRLSEKKAADLRTLVDLLTRNMSKTGDQYLTLQSTLIEAIMLIVFESTPIVLKDNSPLSRQKQIVKHFFNLVVKHYREQHEVAFYANLMDITPKYLSMMVRAETGEAASQWLNRIVVFGSKKLLRTTTKSVNEIAEEMHFSSASAFIRFFKTQTGTTPLAYRY